MNERTSEETRGPGAVQQLANDLVVEERDGGPGDALVLVLDLLGVQGQLDEDLLELLVHVVDAQLFEGVALEHLEAVDIQHSCGVRW